MRYCPSTWTHIFKNARRLVLRRALAISRWRRRTAALDCSASNSLLTSSISILEYQTSGKRIAA